jgi:putative phosphoribosyl transferase
MQTQPFRDRAEAGQLLVQRLQSYADHPDVIVLGLPRGGIPVAYEIAQGLAAPLDVYLVRKLGVPDQPELAMGAIAHSGNRYLNLAIMRQCRVGVDELARVTRQEWQELERRDFEYRQGRPPPDLTHKVVVVVDDGLATGATMFAALAALRQQSVQRLVAAIPVAPATSLQQLSTRADEVVCLMTPESFQSVGEWYVDFSQTSDAQVCSLLAVANR